MSDAFEQWKRGCEGPPFTGDLKVTMKNGTVWLFKDVKIVSHTISDEPMQAGQPVESLQWIARPPPDGTPAGYRLDDFLRDGRYLLNGDAYTDVEGLLIAMCEAGECTEPPAYLEYVLRSLEVFAHRLGGESRPANEWQNEHDALRLACHGGEGAAQHFLIWALALDLVEYGSSPHSAWLTEAGEQLLALLREWKAGQ